MNPWYGSHTNVQYLHWAPLEDHRTTENLKISWVVSCSICSSASQVQTGLSSSLGLPSMPFCSGDSATSVTSFGFSAASILVSSSLFSFICCFSLSVLLPEVGSWCPCRWKDRCLRWSGLCHMPSMCIYSLRICHWDDLKVYQKQTGSTIIPFPK